MDKKKIDVEKINVISIPGEVQTFSELFLQLPSKLETVSKQITTEALSLEYFLSGSVAHTCTYLVR